MHAQIRYRKSDAGESEKLKPFLYIGNYFAQFWNRQVVFDAPHGREVSPETKDDQRVVYVHFFAFPPAPSQGFKAVLGYAFHLYGFEVPRQDLKIEGSGPVASVSGNDIAARFKSVRGSQGYPVIRSPERRAVAQIAGNHIYILFDLAHRPWTPAEPILWEILEQATPYVTPNAPDDPASLGLLIAAHQKLRAKSLKKIEALRPGFAAVSRLLMESDHRQTLAALRDRQLEILSHESTLMELATKIEILKEMIDNPEKDTELSPEGLRQEFELIHRYKGLLGIQVKGDELHIYTEPIVHVRSLDGREHQLSQYKIIIKPDANKFSPDGTVFDSILMTEWGWQGPYYHPEANIRDTFGKAPKGPCFGNSYVTSVRKALFDFDFKVLVALLLHYLDSDDRESAAREESKCNPEPYKPKPFYVDEAARNIACEDYIRFSKKFRGSTRQRYLKGLLAEAESQRENALVSWQEQRKLYVLLEAKARFVRSYLDRLSVDEELKTILNLPSFALMRVGQDQDFIWCVFGPGKGLANFKDVWFAGTFRILFRIFTGEVKIYCGPSVTGILHEKIEYDGKLKYACALSALKICPARGLYGKMIAFICNIVRGETPNTDITLEDITDKQIIDYIRKETVGLWRRETNEVQNVD